MEWFGSILNNALDVGVMLLPIANTCKLLLAPQLMLELRLEFIPLKENGGKLSALIAPPFLLIPCGTPTTTTAPVSAILGLTLLEVGLLPPWSNTTTKVPALTLMSIGILLKHFLSNLQ
jgi:hypothetical protein